MFSWEKVTILQQIGKMGVVIHVSKLFVIKNCKRGNPLYNWTSVRNYITKNIFNYMQISRIN